MISIHTYFCRPAQVYENLQSILVICLLQMGSKPQKQSESPFVFVLTFKVARQSGSKTKFVVAEGEVISHCGFKFSAVQNGNFLTLTMTDNADRNDIFVLEEQDKFYCIFTIMKTSMMVAFRLRGP
jgi:hypothetical protein